MLRKVTYKQLLALLLTGHVTSESSEPPFPHVLKLEGEYLACRVKTKQNNKHKVNAPIKIFL